MLITSSRKPSASTRTLCKHLASFFGCEYTNRGKMGMGEVLDLSHNTPFIVVGEYHGNPGSMVFYGPGGSCVLSLYMSVLNAPSRYPGRSSSPPSISGDNELVTLISDLIYPQLPEGSSSSLSLEINEGMMDFMENGRILFTLKLKSHIIYDGDDPCS